MAASELSAPRERIAEPRLLAEMSVGRVVLLSTHIVDDVATLCPRLAVIRSGEVVSDTTPTAARTAVDGLVREGFVDDAALPAFAKEHRMLSAVLVEGRTNRVRIFLPTGAEAPPGFAPSPGTLEDAYLVLMRCPPHEIPGPLARAVPASATSAIGGAR